MFEDMSLGTSLSKHETLSHLVKELENDDVYKWTLRVENSDFFNESYIPVPRESREVDDLANHYSPAGLQSKSHEDIYSHILSQKSVSVLMKREPVICNHNTIETISELILLNRYFIISSVTFKKENSSEESNQNELNHALNVVVGLTKKFSKNVGTLLGKKTIDCCFNLTSIVGIQNEKSSLSFLILVKSGKLNVVNYQITCATIERKEAWVHAIQVATLRNYDIEKDSLIGASFCNDISKVIQSVESNTIQIDDSEPIHGFNALHFAVINSNLDIITELLKGGSDPDIFSNDGLAPISFAKSSINDDIIDLLLSYGAQNLVATTSSSQQSSESMSSGSNEKQDRRII
mmetsp:Transcript_26792/g.33041  ORF Transcript_26792/g.33041 Transcript_26792/m.33041 type:complete len:349 (-) Transcript_26792:234-1280(-)